MLVMPVILGKRIADIYIYIFYLRNLLFNMDSGVSQTWDNTVAEYLLDIPGEDEEQILRSTIPSEVRTLGGLKLSVIHIAVIYCNLTDGRAWRHGILQTRN